MSSTAPHHVAYYNEVVKTIMVWDTMVSSLIINKPVLALISYINSQFKFYIYNLVSIYFIKIIIFIFQGAAAKRSFVFFNQQALSLTA